MTRRMKTHVNPVAVQAHSCRSPQSPRQDIDRRGRKLLVVNGIRSLVEPVALESEQQKVRKFSATRSSDVFHIQ